MYGHVGRNLSTKVISHIDFGPFVPVVEISQDRVPQHINWVVWIAMSTSVPHFIDLVKKENYGLYVGENIDVEGLTSRAIMSVKV